MKEVVEEETRNSEQGTRSVEVCRETAPAGIQKGIANDQVKVERVIWRGNKVEQGTMKLEGVFMPGEKHVFDSAKEHSF